MVCGMRTGYPRGLNKGLGSKFRNCSQLQEGSRVRQQIPEEGRRAHRPKLCTDNNENEDNSLNNTNNGNLCGVPSWRPASKTASCWLHQLCLKSVAEAVSLEKKKKKKKNQLRAFSTENPTLTLNTPSQN